MVNTDPHSGFLSNVATVCSCFPAQSYYIYERWAESMLFHIFCYCFHGDVHRFFLLRVLFNDAVNCEDYIALALHEWVCVCAMTLTGKMEVLEEICGPVTFCPPKYHVDWRGIKVRPPK